MRHVRGLLLFTSALAIAAPAAHGAAKHQVIDSHWRDGDVVIDGQDGEWAGPLLPIDEKRPLTAAAVNDGQFLYLVLTTSDPSLRRQILRQGLIVWFDPAGGEKKHFGVKFPVGAGPGDMPGRGRRGPRGAGSSSDPSSGIDQLEPPSRLEVLGPKKDDARSLLTEVAPGIAVKVGQVEGSLVYELKVPLAKTAEFSYAIETKPGASIGLGLETPKMERPSREGREGGGGGMGGRGRGGVGGRGGGGMGRGGERRGGFEQPKPLKSWATLQLAAH